VAEGVGVAMGEFDGLPPEAGVGVGVASLPSAGDGTALTEAVGADSVDSGVVVAGPGDEHAPARSINAAAAARRRGDRKLKVCGIYELKAAASKAISR
jgi:hypothetical protein